MVRLPTRDDLGPLPSARSGRLISTYDVSAVGRGAEALGRGVQQLGADIKGFADKQLKQAAFDTERKLQEFEWQREQAYYKAVDNMQPGAKNFEETFAAQDFEARKQFSETVPEQFRPAVDDKLLNSQHKFSRFARIAAEGEQFRFNKNAVNVDLDNIYIPRAEQAVISSGDVIPKAKTAIASIESGDKGYAAMGPVLTKGRYKGDRAYGKYGVMGMNIPSWTKEAVGVSMTPQEFMKPENRWVQDKVFEHHFGKAVAKYGNVADAASVWFTGSKITGASSKARDELGTTGKAYVEKFMTAMDGTDTAVASIKKDWGRFVHSNPALNDIEADKIIHAGNQKIARAYEKEKKVRDEVLFIDEKSSLLNTGSSLGFLNYARLNDSQTKELDHAKFQYDISREIANAQSSEFRPILDRLKPEGEGFAGEQARFDFARDAINERIKKQKDDAAGYEVEKQTPAGVAYTQAMESQDSVAVQSAILGLRIEQARKGVPPENIRSVPKAIAGDISSRIKDADDVDKAFANFMQQKEFYGETFAGVTENMDDGWSDVNHLVDAGEISHAKSLTHLVHADLYGPDAKIGMRLFDTGKKFGIDPAIEVARSIFDGRLKRRTKGYTPSGKSEDTDETADQTIQRVVGDTFSNAPDVFNAVREAALSFYANTADAGADLNSEKMADAVQKVTGGVLEHNSDDGTGMFLAPVPYFSNSQFSAMLNEIRNDDLDGIVVGDQFPHPVTGDMLRNEMQLISVGNGVYQLRYGATGPIARNSETDQEFELNILDWMPDLIIRGTERRKEMEKALSGEGGAVSPEEALGLGTRGGRLPAFDESGRFLGPTDLPARQQ